MKYGFGLVVCVCFFFGLSLRAQTPGDTKLKSERPDNEAIFQEILDPNSPYYYPALMTRYAVGDTSLNLNDYRHLYYGYVYQVNYRPFETPEASLRILTLLERGLDSLTVGDYEDIRDHALQVMEMEPFSLGNINFLILAYGALGDQKNERINFYRLQMVIQAIKSSGDGMREKSPWHVTYFSHATDLLSTMNVLYGRRTVVSRTTEFIPLLSRNETRGYYFDFSRVYMFQPEMEPQRKPTGWEFNGIPIKKYY